MFTRKFRRILALIVATLSLTLIHIGSVRAQDQTPTPEPPPPACVPDGQTACVRIVFYPSALVGDLFIADQPTAQVQQSELWVTFANPAPGQTTDVAVKNIHDGSADNGMLYVYPDKPLAVSVPYAAGQTKTMTLYPAKQYIRGKVEAKCSPSSVAEGEEVACVVTIDDVLQEANLAAGQKTTYILDPGPHTLKFDLVGANASQWFPSSRTKAVTVYAGSYPKFAYMTFAKGGHVVATLSEAEWVADFYLDGTLVGSQVASIDQWVKGNATHKVDVTNVARPGSPGIHPFKDATSTFYSTSGATKTLSISLDPAPPSLMVNPTGGIATTDQYVVLTPAWKAATLELVNQNADHFHWTISLNGVFIGDVTPYRRDAILIVDADTCKYAEVCFLVAWLIPLGRLPEGSYTIHYDLSIDTDLFNGWTTYSPCSCSWDDSFLVIAKP